VTLTSDPARAASTVAPGLEQRVEQIPKRLTKRLTNRLTKRANLASFGLRQNHESPANRHLGTLSNTVEASHKPLVPEPEGCPKGPLRNFDTTAASGAARAGPMLT
jgi:hypothetical protein